MDQEISLLYFVFLESKETLNSDFEYHHYVVAPG